MATELLPLGDLVFVRPIEDEESVGGVLIPTSARDKPRRGLAIAVGPDALDVSVGDEVFYSPHAASELLVDDEDVCVLHASDLLAVAV